MKVYVMDAWSEETGALVEVYARRPDAEEALRRLKERVRHPDDLYAGVIRRTVRG